ncbi:hypothetical protein LEP1GSC051_0130 [Leptospira sp. P2653]|nr:hypothetical protein LEP1GSC051_0130 [Leptospira sp. P2653]
MAFKKKSKTVRRKKRTSTKISKPLEYSQDIQKRYNSTKRPTLLAVPKKPKRNATITQKKKYLEKLDSLNSRNTKKLREWRENINEAKKLDKKIFG